MIGYYHKYVSCVSVIYKLNNLAQILNITIPPICTYSIKPQSQSYISFLLYMKFSVFACNSLIPMLSTHLQVIIVISRFYLLCMFSGPLLIPVFD